MNTRKIHSKEIVYFSSIPWNFSWHRQQEMMTYMAEHGYKILFVEPCSKMHPFDREFEQIAPGIWRLQPCGMPYERCLRAIHCLNAKISHKQIGEVSEKLKFKNPIIWLDRVHGVDFPYYQGEHYIIYDLVDEILAFGRVRNKKLLISLENQVLKRADTLLSSSRTLMERKILQSGRSETAVFLPNGVDCRRFDHSEYISSSRSIVVGFVGEISKRRLDFDIISYIAKKKSDWSFVFVGPGNEHDKEALRELSSNISVEGPVNGECIPEVIQGFDVGIIPYNVEKEDMDYVFPRKACEYLASGKAVVCTPLKEVKQLAPYVLVASDGREFADKLEEAVGKSSITPESRRTFAKEFDWNCLMESLLNDLSQFEMETGSKYGEKIQ